ncbi:MAG: NYN domain-containing protein [Clostridium sp.]|nr:NYN domain-containing protein [Clostridium sp.]
MRDRKIVLLIDAENTSARYAKRMVEYLEKRGDIICARIYGDFINNASVKGWNSVAIEYEMEQKQQLTTSAGKNSSDIALVIDAMDLLYQKNIDTLCIVTSDGDFTGLVKRIREDGIEVIGIGKADASKRLEKVCDQYLDFDELAEENTGSKKQADAEKNKKTEKKKDKKQGKAEKDKNSSLGKTKETGEHLKKGKKEGGKANSEKGKKKNTAENDSKAVKKASLGGSSLKVGTKRAVWGNESKEGKDLKPEEKAKGSGVKADLGSKEVSVQENRKTDREKLGEIKTFIHEIVQQEEKNGKHAELGGIKSQLQLKYAGFDESEFGYKTIRDLINEETKFQVVLEGRHTYVVPEKSVDMAGKTRQDGRTARQKDSHEYKTNKPFMGNQEISSLQDVSEVAVSEENTGEKTVKKTGFSLRNLVPKRKE